MATVQVKITGGESQSRLNERFQSAFLDVAPRLMTVATELTLAEAIQLSPVDRGIYRNAFTQQVVTQGLVVSGNVSNTSAHAGVIEDGRRPGAKMPPVGAIMGWLGRVAGITDPRQLRSRAFLVARAISRRGIVAKKVIERAVTAKRAEVDRLFGEVLPQEIGKRL